LAGRVLRRAPEPVQDAIRQGRRRLQATLHRGRDHAAVWQSPPVPTPNGISLADLERSFRSWSVNDEPAGHLDAYWGEAICRFLHTWDMVREDRGSCLELGANPYFTTYLLDEHTKLDLSLANYYGERGAVIETVSFVPPRATERKQVERHAQLFNVEQDEFPYESGSFDVVLFCELLEHLLMDPVATLRQIHRVLKPGGVLVLTTPNVARLDNVLAMVGGANIYDPYSGFGPYGRHNREYIRHELHRLLDFAGFDVEHSFTADGHPTDHTRSPRYKAVAPLVDFRREDLGQYLFVRARASRQPADKLPSFLYRSWPDGEIIPFD
jgi:SAM-dependent methyltransferase